MARSETAHSSPKVAFQGPRIASERGGGRHETVAVNGRDNAESREGRAATVKVDCGGRGGVSRRGGKGTALATAGLARSSLNRFGSEDVQVGLEGQDGVVGGGGRGHFSQVM